MTILNSIHSFILLSLLAVPAAAQQQPATPAERPLETPAPPNPNACENRAQASAAILDLVDRITSGLVKGSVEADSASASMQRLLTASQRLSRDDVPGACTIVRAVRRQYRFTVRTQSNAE